MVALLLRKKIRDAMNHYVLFNRYQMHDDIQ